MHDEDPAGREAGPWGSPGGRHPPAGAPIGQIPPAVAVVAAVLAAIYVAMEIAPAPVADALSDRYGLSPARLFAGPNARDGLVGMIAPLFTHQLIHATIAHLLFNLLWLVVFGAPIARRWRDGLRFAVFFFLCGAAGGVFFSLFHLRDPTLLVGASGGITGLLGGLVRFAFHRPGTKARVLPLTDRNVITWTAVVVAMNASVVLIGPSVGAGDADIAWQAHVGGYLFGLVAFPAFDKRGMGVRN